MAYPYTPTPVDPNTAYSPAFAAPYAPAAPAPNGPSGPGPGAQQPVPLPPMPFRPEGRRGPRRGIIVAAGIGAFVAVLVVGLLGLYVGSRLTNSTAPQQQPTQATAPGPTADQVHAATVDLCTRFAAGYRAMPSPQNTGFDVIPSLNYIADALRDNPVADSKIRDAVSESLRLAREQASHLSNEPARGAIQPSTSWTPEAANAADQRVWDLCRAYGG